ncbi:osmotically-inducible lipoprotein OsmE [Pseudomonas alkylphenolica]|uniref:osmotically-inducible lipoprotein OsmE n=1 Tax=Pseudomonas alkylphenolica TaxID=237609 RepID=UPI0018D841DE|nr:osmotically-inducible lipoprotein OsmE [Pseudomonas alkylphenolica]MBH3430922.1 osmotically-inducible lipoprotein OsmE [Pseudomonas alkylphenolica]
MNTQSLLLVVALAAIGGCIGNPLIYRDQPLVAQVENGMSKRQVLELGGPPLHTTRRTEHPGTCNDYLFHHNGQSQPYLVSFDSNDRVDHKDFFTCADWEAEQKNAKIPFYMDPGYGKMQSGR